MKHLIALSVLLIASGAAVADPPSSKTNDSTNQMTVESHRVEIPASENPSMPQIAPDAEPVTVTASRPRSLDISSEPGFVDFRSTTPRTLSAPLAFDVVTKPVLLTVGTGNTEELRKPQVQLPFQSVQDSTVRTSDVIKIRLATFKIK